MSHNVCTALAQPGKQHGPYAHLVSSENPRGAMNKPLAAFAASPHRRKYSLMDQERDTAQARDGWRRTALLAAATALGLCVHALAAQNGIGPPAPSVKARFMTNHFPTQPSLTPTASIPLDPLGFTAPSLNYLGARNSFVSLDFLGEDRLLLTFRVPGLIHRDAKGDDHSDEREIRAEVLKLPQAAGEAQIEADALWTVHDRVRYVWPLEDGRFLLRDRKTLFEGDATLKLKPFLDFPGSLLWIELDPEQQYVVANSDEPVPAARKPGKASSPATASAADDTDQDEETAAQATPEFVVRVLQRDTGKVILVSRVHAAIHLPINSQGYLENLRGQGMGWILNFGYFTGGSKMLGSVETSCDPVDNFLSENEILVEGCNQEGARKLVAITTGGRTLWIAQAPPTQVWPQLTVAANGSRLAWATLDTSNPVGPFAPMGSDNVKEQSVTVFDAATGDIVLVSPLSPMLDAGGNVAISPSGRRVALLNDGAIEIFDLPPAPPVPAQ